MTSRYVFTYFMAFFFFPLLAFAQNGSCVYMLEIKDATGQGWNGAALELKTRSTSQTYTLDEGKQQQRFFFQVSNNDTITLNFSPGTTNEAVAFGVYGPEGDTLYQSAGTPALGQVFRGIVSCPACPVPNIYGIHLDDVRAYSAAISWIPSDASGLYLFEFDTTGFTRGKGRLLPVAGTSIKLIGLNQHTSYDFYLSVRCTSGDTSKVVGPFSFKTRWANDVGVSTIFAPESGCELEADSIKVGITNYGGEPQSLIPFLYAVNGKKASISMPKDGLFTGIVGKDSTEEAAFDVVYDFSAPGEYLVQAWTELKSDSMQANDSVSVLVVSTPTISSFPYFTNLDQGFTGWYVDAKSQAATWKLGTPDGNVLKGAFSGQRSWITNPTGAYNAQEWSYLISPCLDFTSLRSDPTLSLALRIDAELCCDGAWIEMSIDAGETWTVLGQSNSGLNWYNNATRQVWTGDGGAPGWFTAAHTLTGVAGLPDVRLRVVFRADYARNFEGIAVDNIRIAVSDRDMAALNVRNNGNLTCGATNDQVVFSVGNLGKIPVSGLQLAYQVNNGQVVRESLGNQSLNPGQKLEFPFNTRFNSLNPGSYTIKAWIVSTDDTPVNDTIFYTFTSAKALPFIERFERGTTPKDWALDSDLIVTNSRQNTSYVLSDNLFANDRTMQATTPAFGPIEKGDSLTFDYRFADITGTLGATLGTADKLEVLISTDCGATFRQVAVINSLNHTVSAQMKKFSVRLDSFTNQYIRIRFLASWGQGDYYIDLDNIQVLRCPPSLGLSIVVAGAGTSGKTATVLSQSLSGPYSYTWNTGGTTPSIPLLSNGTFTVTVTDRNGCQDIASTLVTSTREQLVLEKLSLAPNPTSGSSQLTILFPEATPTTIQVISLYGQVLQEARFNSSAQINMDIHLNTQPDGLYFIRILANGKSRTEKLTLIKP